MTRRAGQPDRGRLGAGQPGGRVRHAVHPAEDPEPRAAPRSCSRPRAACAATTRTRSRSRSSAGPSSRSRRSASQGPFLVGGGGDVTVSAKYFAGRPARRRAGRPGRSARPDQLHAAQPRRLRVRRLAAVVGADRASTRPRAVGGIRRFTPPRTWTLAGKTDATGAHTLHLDFLSVEPGGADVGDRHRARSPTSTARRWPASAALIVHPSSLLRRAQDRAAVRRQGHAVRARRDRRRPRRQGRRRARRSTSRRCASTGSTRRASYTTKEVDPQTCAAVAARDPAPCSFQTRDGGEYQLTATIVDAQGRPNQTRLTFWVSRRRRSRRRATSRRSASS